MKESPFPVWHMRWSLPGKMVDITNEETATKPTVKKDRQEKLTINSKICSSIMVDSVIA